MPGKSGRSDRSDIARKTALHEIRDTLRPVRCGVISPIAANGSICSRPPIVMTVTDHSRLSAFVRAVPMDAAAADFLREELDRAEIVHGEVSARNLVMIGSTVKIVDDCGTSIRQIKLVPPNVADRDDLVPVTGILGAALIGLGPGQTIQWCDGKATHRTTVLEIR